MRYLALPLLLLGTVPATAVAQPTLRHQVMTMGVTEEVVIVDHPSVPLRTLTSGATAVVHVAVRGSDTFLSGDGTAILTDYRVSIVEVVKAPAGAGLAVGDVITIRRSGGVMDIEGRRFFSSESGFPPFAARAEYVLFLKPGSGQPFEMAAGPRSAFRVHEGTVAPLADEPAGASAVLMPLFLHEVRELANDRAIGAR